MSELTLVSKGHHPLKPLVEAALANELRLVEVAIRRTEQRLCEFETKHQSSTDEFIRRYEDDQLEESLEFAEWVGEYRLLKRLREKAKTLREIQFAN
jgi:phage shock protein A